MNGRRVVLAEYFDTGGQTFLFGMRADWVRPEVVELALNGPASAEFITGHFREPQSILELDRGELWRTYDFLVEPLSRWAQPDDIVCIVPHGILHSLPLHALMVDGVSLIERNAVVYSPSASALTFLQSGRRSGSDRPSAGLSCAVFGDSLGDLPGARAEAVRLAMLFGTEPVLGATVTCSAFRERARGAHVVHFAGHAGFSSVNALDSGLAMADGPLTAADVFGFEDIGSYLVTLSGCRTGQSQNLPGDELIGLTRAFLYAGTRSVLVSLWTVNDDSAAFLMQEFYERLLENPEVFKADAFRAAVLKTKSQRSWGALYHWAPFMIVGDWR